MFWVLIKIVNVHLICAGTVWELNPDKCGEENFDLVGIYQWSSHQIRDVVLGRGQGQQGMARETEKDKRPLNLCQSPRTHRLSERWEEKMLEVR